MRLRRGRRVGEHVYLQAGDEPADSDQPLFTVPDVNALGIPGAEFARLIVVAYNDRYSPEP